MRYFGSTGHCAPPVVIFALIVIRFYLFSFLLLIFCSLLMAQFRQLKLRQLGLHEELQAAIERFKKSHQLGPEFDRCFQDEQQPSSASRSSQVFGATNYAGPGQFQQNTMQLGWR